MKLFSSLVFWKMLFVVLDKLLDLVLKLFLGQSSLQVAASWAHDRLNCGRTWWSRGTLCIGLLPSLGNWLPDWMTLTVLLVMVIMHLLLNGSLLRAVWLRCASRTVRGCSSGDVVLLKRLLVVTIVLGGLILARINWVASCVGACPTISLVVNSWLCHFIALWIFFIAWSFFQWLSLLIIDLAVTITWHDGTLLTVMRILDRLLPNLTISQSWVCWLTSMVLLEMVYLLVLGVSSSYYILFSISHAILDNNIGIVVTIVTICPWLDTTLLNRSKGLVGSMNRAYCPLGWDLIGWVLPWLTNSKLQKLFDVLGWHLGRSSNLNYFCLCLVMSSSYLLGSVRRGVLVCSRVARCRMAWTLSWVDSSFWRCIMIYAAGCCFWASVHLVFPRLIRCVSSEEISAFWTDLKVSWTWTSQSLVCVWLSHHIVWNIASSMSSILSVFHCLLLLVWNLLQKRKVIGFSVFFSNFWWIHIYE